MVIIGGVDSSQSLAYNYDMGTFMTADIFPQAIGVFDMTEWTFQTTFNASKSVYTSASQIKEIYNNGSGQPEIWASNALQTLFSVTHFNTSMFFLTPILSYISIY
jgi:hypothetical protein